MGADLLGSSFQYDDSTETGSTLLYDDYEMTKDKYIIIGALDGDDTHYTYMENQPGSIILFNAYLALLKGNHRIPYWGIVFMFCVYFVLGFRILGIPDIFKQAQSPKVEFKLSRIFLSSILKSWIKYSFFLAALSTFTYLTWHVVYDIFITATIFDIIKSVVLFYYTIQKRKEHV